MTLVGHAKHPKPRTSCRGGEGNAIYTASNTLFNSLFALHQSANHDACLVDNGAALSSAWQQAIL